MTVMLLKEIPDPSILGPEDYAAFVDHRGRLELRLVGVDPWGVHTALREAGFRSVHTWVAERGEDPSAPVELRVTAVSQ